MCIRSNILYVVGFWSRNSFLCRSYLMLFSAGPVGHQIQFSLPPPVFLKTVHISTPEQEEGRGGLFNDEGSLYTVVQFQLISQPNDWITDQEDYYVVWSFLLVYVQLISAVNIGLLTNNPYRQHISIHFITWMVVECRCPFNRCGWTPSLKELLDLKHFHYL